MKEKEFVIIGGGQCGLSAGRYLQKKGCDFVILEQNKEIGDNWRNQYDSLKLFTPAQFSALPDLPMALSPKARPTKDQMADYFSRYASHFDMPVHNKNKVLTLKKNKGAFLISTVFEEIKAQKVIIANGFCQKPKFPEWVNDLNTPYLHSKDYRNPISVKGKKVLVVGTGNSAAQIAAELTKYYEVHWSVNRKPKLTPLYIFGKNVIWWASRLGILDRVAKKGQKRIETIYQYDNLKKQLKKTKKQPIIKEATGNQVLFENGKKEQYDFVVFATGFYPDFDFIEIEDFENNLETLRENSGLSRVKGLYFLGIPFQRTKSSHLIHGSQKDAKFIIEEALS
ncbi:NAD(P)/FAD-dependent oxidoreductase [Echinicola jeungdonensis]|uniref:Flavin-containing monooxygenase n=1 Tax=Echinicola jeungdonensis TaxID=709343 RepID=A0ABV5J3D6_9BACT|nr:NAD(P)/FAD-dependent oxidoreductase [Echinicola jeungdonensis]MDN3669597.1 NAD(P)/FAD-dependent oxidoreductase [Echinicola jeungdonensis]